MSGRIGGGVDLDETIEACVEAARRKFVEIRSITLSANATVITGRESKQAREAYSRYDWMVSEILAAIQDPELKT